MMSMPDYANTFHEEEVAATSRDSSSASSATTSSASSAVTTSPPTFAAADMPIRIYGAVPDSIVDGPHLRYALFVQGCSHACPGCHNPESQPREGGTLTTLGAIRADIRSNGLVRDVTFSGGEPFEQAVACAALARQLKEDGYGIWTYTGYLYEELERVAAAADTTAKANAKGATRAAAATTGTAADESAPRLDPQGVAELLASTDVLVDGPFIQSLRSLGLKWCGSSNQRLIDVAATRAAGHIVEWHTPNYLPQKPASW